MKRGERFLAMREAFDYAHARGGDMDTCEGFGIWYVQQAPEYDALPPLPGAWLTFNCETAPGIRAA